MCNSCGCDSSTFSLLDLLRQGETAESIQKKLMEQLNEAQEAFMKEQAKAEAEAKARREKEIAAAREAERKGEIAEIVDLLIDFMAKWYPGLDEMIPDAGERELLADSFESAMDDMMNSLTPLMRLRRELREMVGTGEAVAKEAKASDDDILAGFLKQYGLLS